MYLSANDFSRSLHELLGISVLALTLVRESGVSPIRNAAVIGKERS
jgi:hypothetical protein